MRRLAAIVIAMVAAGVAMLAWAFTELQGAYGPSYGALLSDGRLVLASHGYLHVFEGEQRVARLSFKEVGLGSAVSDLDPGPDGTVLAADSDTRSLRRCRLEVRGCAAFYDSAAHPDGAPRQAFKAAVEPGTGRVVLSDASNHRLLLLDAQGGLRQATPKNGPRFTFPNGIAFLGEGVFVVADTDHVRIAFVRLAGEGFGPDEKELRIRRVFPGSDLLYPIDVVAEPGGGLWTILANNSLQSGTVAAMQVDGGKPRHIALQAPADPLSLVALRGAILVLEPTTYRVTRVDSATGAQGLLLFALIAAVAIAVRSGAMRVFPQWRPKWQIPSAPSPLVAGTDWIEANPLPGRAVTVAYLGVSLLALGGLYLWLRSVVKAGADYWLRLELILVLLVLMALLVLFLVGRLSRGRLGVDGRALFVDDAGRKFEAPLTEVLYSGTRLLVGHHIVWLRLAAGDRYPRERIASAILARLPESARLGEWRLSATYLARCWRRVLPRA